MAGLEIQALTVAFGGVHALHDVDLTLDGDRVVGLIGPNGAGKTTLIDAVTGFVPATSGHVRFAGRDLAGAGPAERARLGLVRTFQSLELFEDLSVVENLQVAAERPRWWQPLADAVRPQRAREEGADWALDVLDLADVADRRPDELSHGRRKLVAVARALASRPRLVLLDEPAAGLDGEETRELGQRIRSLPEHGVSVLLVDHDMGLVLGTCDRVVVLETGEVIADGPPDAIRRDPAVVEAYLGTTVP
jgi:branched-chain amino acid transport system ATP-binding protein